MTSEYQTEDQIIEKYLNQNTDEESNEAISEDIEEVPKIHSNSALDAIDLLKFFIVQEEGNNSFINYLSDIESFCLTKKRSKCIQKKMDEYL